MPATATTKRSRESRSPLAPGDYLETPVRDIMTPGVVSIPEDASLVHVYRAITAHSVRAVLVVGRTEGRPLGWVTARGLLGWIGKDESLVSARDAVTERATFVEPSATAREAIVALLQAGVSHVLVRRSDDSMPEGVLSDLDLVALEGE
ncbi:MAG: CBS domain-containing protein [Solirubrobacterales bacterium]